MAEKSGSSKRASQLSKGGPQLPKNGGGPPGTKTGTPKTPTNHAASRPALVHCVCSSIEDVGLLVECESCSRWSHSKCVGITRCTATSFPFVCPFCVKLLFSRLAAAELEIDALRTRISTLESPAEQCQAHGAEIDRLNNSLQQASLNPLVPKIICSSYTHNTKLILVKKIFSVALV